MSETIVAGGGIAGIASALRLAESGVKVTLLETRKKLGGRATSFLDPRTGLTIDNCQHVALGCCTNYLDLLRRLGALDQIRWDRQQHWVERGGRVSAIRAGLLPAPLHFTSSVLRASFLTGADLLSLVRIGPAIIRADRSKHVKQTFAAFLKRHGQTDRLINRFWSPVVISACNLSVDKVSAASALHVFQDGFFASPRAADIGVSRIPLVQLYDRAEGALAAAGGVIRLGCGVERITPHSVTTTGGETLSAKHVICALPVERAAEVIGPELRHSDPRIAAMDRFTFSPILGVHLTFDRPVMSLPHAVLVEGDTQWLFRKDDEGRALHAVISAADAWMDLTEEQITAKVLADIHAYFPGSTSAKLLSARSVKEKRATFAPTPEIEMIRPSAIGVEELNGVILAGDYTATGWPATMEGAARSGYTAAAAILGKPPADLLTPDLRPSLLYRALGVRTSTGLPH